MYKIFSYIIFTFSISLLVTACNKKTVPVVEEKAEVLVQPTVEDVINSELPTSTRPTSAANSGEEDCHGVRKVVQVITDRQGMIVRIGNRYLISSLSGTSRYKTCEIPAHFRKEDMLITYSGEALEIFHNERLMGTPFRITDIKETKK